MFDIGCFKAQPTEWMRRYASGKIKSEDTGLNFTFPQHNAQIVLVPLSSRDVPWFFNEVTNSQ